METLYDPCIACGNPLVTVTQGSEMKIKDLIVV
jgi:Zn finger protein HypA/HybF involved in hydrogenase expression